MVIDPKAFFEEVDQIQTQGISVTPERLKVSSRAHLIMPYHRALDHTSEERLGNEKIGTTLRGIGPAYEDKAGRRGIRVADALVPELLKLRIERNLEEANRIIVLYGREPLRSDEIFEEISALVERLRPFVCETSHFLAEAKKRNEKILLEGAQATLLDVAWASRRITFRACSALSGPMPRGSAKDPFRPKCSTSKRQWRISSASAATNTARSRNARAAAAGSTPSRRAMRRN
jgi:adenylosuccinate synthase